MIDSYLRNHYQKVFVDRLLIKGSPIRQLSPIAITFVGCLLGVATLPLLAFGKPNLAFLFLCLSGYLDTLDGSLARATNKTSNVGGALDIVSDRIVEFSLVLGLYCIDPISRALPCLLMCGSILICITTFLVVGIFTENNSQKSFYYSPGIMERAEAFLFFGIMILFPTTFSVLSILFTLLVTLTGIIRIYQFSKQAALLHK